ncbi:MAG: RNA-binding S4 domain-containing protein [Bacteroidetes bacterium]|nr:RNA-binding S4 domain-containing protein [Bacteroidota bacterium]
MQTFALKAPVEFIELNKLLKVMHWVGTGGEAHVHIDSGMVKVNGQVETRKRRKLLPGDWVEFSGRSVQIEGYV